MDEEEIAQVLSELDAACRVENCECLFFRAAEAIMEMQNLLVGALEGLQHLRIVNDNLERALHDRNSPTPT